VAGGIALIKEAKELENKELGNCVFLLAGENFSQLDKAISILKSKGINFAGAIFPKIVYGDMAYDDAALIWRLHDGEIFYFEDIENITVDQLKRYKRNGFKSMLVFVDGLTSYIRNFLDKLHETFGSRIRIAGAGAGSIFKDIKPIITPEGIIKGGAAGFFLRKDIKVNVGHGWQRFYGPLIATKTKGNIITELNWQPAFEVYKQVIRELAGVEVNESNFFNVAKFYSFGMIREGEEDIIRDPIKVLEDGSIECVGDVPENSVLFIMKGEIEKLIQGSKQTCGFLKRGSRIVLNCVSRTMVLGERFKEELKNFGSDGFGVLTVGEIVPLSNGYPMFYNKTTVCVAVEK